MQLNVPLIAAMRRDGYDGHEWLDSTTLASSRATAEWLAWETDVHTGPSWAAANPVVRYARVKLVECSKE